MNIPDTHSHPLGTCLEKICEIVHPSDFVHHPVFKIQINSRIKLAKDKISSYL